MNKGLIFLFATFFLSVNILVSRQEFQGTLCGVFLFFGSRELQ